MCLIEGCLLSGFFLLCDSFVIFVGMFRYLLWINLINYKLKMEGDYFLYIFFKVFFILD